jgi:hypothetical protein
LGDFVFLEHRRNGQTRIKTIFDIFGTDMHAKITKEFENLSKRLAETELTLSLIRKVLTPEMLTKLQLEQLHKEYGEEHKQKPPE